MEEFKLRKALLKDQPVLLEFEQKVLEAERPYNSSIKLLGASYYNLKDLLTSKNSYLVVAEVKDTIVASGYAQVRTSKPSLTHDLHCYLGFMYVVPEYRRLGINQKIVEKLVTWSNSQGIPDCYLDVYAGNKAAIRAYQKVGFVKSMIEMKLNI